jgi:hypothetical protein
VALCLAVVGEVAEVEGGLVERRWMCLSEKSSDCLSVVHGGEVRIR